VSEWLGKPYVKREELARWLRETPFMGSIARWFLEQHCTHVELVIPKEWSEKLERKMVEKYGSVSAANLRRLCMEALREYLEK